MGMNLEPELKPGDLIVNGRYRVDAFLGRGAFAQLYRVRHMELNVDRAVKVVSADTPGVGSSVLDDFRARFRLEAQLGARVDHPHVIRIYDFEEAEGRLYLVMEYASGGSLARRLRNTGPLPVTEATRLILQAAAGLEALHRLSVVHRDVKPSNILLDSEGRAKIADLGLAQLPGSPSQRSRLGSVAPSHPGTPEYMSPEQASSPEYLTASSDVYSLGCVWFELLTGRAWADAMREVEDVRQLRPEAPLGLARVLARMCQPEPARRKADAGDPNKRYLSMEAVRQALLTATQPAQPAIPRSWLAAGVVAALVLLVGLIGWGVVARSWQTPALNRPAVYETRTAVAVLLLSTPSTSTPVPPAAATAAFTPSPSPVLAAPTATVVHAASATPVPPPTPQATSTASSTHAPTTGATFTAHPSPFPTPTPTSTASRSATPTPTLFVTPTPSATATPSPTASLTPTPLPTIANTATVAFVSTPTAPDVVLSAENADQVVQLISWEKGAVEQVAYSPDGRLLAIAVPSGIYLHDMRTLAEMRFFKTDAELTGVAFSPDGTLLAAGSRDGTVRLLRVTDGTPLHTLAGQSGAVWSVAFSPDGKLLASGVFKMVRLWRVADGTWLRNVEGRTSSMSCVVFSPDGTLLASGLRDGTVQVWRASDGAPVETLEGHTNWVTGVAFSPDGTQLVSGALDNTLRLWRVSDGYSLRTLGEHNAAVNSVTFSPDGTLLASGSQDGTVHLWRMPDGVELRALSGGAASVRTVAFSPDGTSLASGSQDGTVRLWGVSQEAPAAGHQKRWRRKPPGARSAGLRERSPAGWGLPRIAQEPAPGLGPLSPEVDLRAVTAAELMTIAPCGPVAKLPGTRVAWTPDSVDPYLERARCADEMGWDI
jgi:WD40 repeat protein